MTAAVLQESPDTGPLVLVVDDDTGIRTLVADCLLAEGYRVETAADARSMDAVLARVQPDLIVLDIMMPGEDGLTACRRLARGAGPPVLLLSARSEEADRVAGLDVGATHYLPKPCSPRELVATVRAALRARGDGMRGARAAFAFDGWTIDFGTRELTDPGGVLVNLTEGEFAVLKVFVERSRRVLARDALLDAARGRDSDAFDRAIDVQVSRLRRKLAAPDDSMIRTIRNEGYFFVPRVTLL
jgi:two-component system, OmpR family, response regulator